MSRRKKSSGAGASLDSLLDTMTNVVGILVIVLVVTQLGVGEAVKRIEGIDAPLLELSQEQIDQVQEKKIQVSQRLKSLVQETAVDESELTQSTASITQLEKELAALQGKINIEEIRKQVEQRKKEQEELDKKVREAQQLIVSLKAKLDTTPTKEAPPPTVIRVPDPRSAPEGAKPVYFVCRQGRVLPFEQDELEKQARLAIKPQVQAIPRDPKKPVSASNVIYQTDPEKALAVFNRIKTRGDQFFQLKLEEINELIYVAFDPKPDAGETVEELESGRSRLERLMKQIQPQRNYARFLVWSDSFDVYNAARNIADQEKVPAGWAAYADNSTHRIYIDIRTPDYKPPKPTPTDPNAPKPLPPSDID